MKLEDSREGKALFKVAEMIRPKTQPPGITDVSVPQQETLLGRQKKKNGYQDTRLAVAGEAPATSWYKETLG